MKIHLAAAMIVGIALGSLGAYTLEAQRTPAGYFVGEILEVSDQAQYNAYAASVSKTVEQYGGHFMVRGGKTESLEGEEPRRIVMLAFNSLDDARKWYNSPEYSAITPLRLASSRSRAFLVEGVAE